MPDDIFSPAFMRKLELLEIVFRRLKSGRGTGEKSGRERGGRIEFREHRRYTPGDDYRMIDWNVYGRTDALFVKEHLREERRTVAVLLDCSRSMQFGRPAKFTRGIELAAAFAYLALVGGDEAKIVAFSEKVFTSVSVAGTKSRITEIFHALRGIKPRGATDINRALKDLASGTRRSLVVLVSDLMGEDSRRSIQLLNARGYEPCVIQLLSRDEAAPRHTGRLRLKDSETGEVRRLWTEGPELEYYRVILHQFIESWKTFCAAHGIAFISALTDQPFEELVLGYLRRGGLLR